MTFLAQSETKYMGKKKDILRFVFIFCVDKLRFEWVFRNSGRNLPFLWLVFYTQIGKNGCFYSKKQDKCADNQSIVKK